jgi:hypothetical protein
MLVKMSVLSMIFRMCSFISCSVSTVMMVYNHLKMLILSRWVNTIPLYVSWIVPRRSPWGATSFEELPSALYRWVCGCH